MSSYTNIFIEYKDSRDNDWHLLRAYVSLEDREWDRTKSQEELEKENTIIFSLGDKRFCESNYLTKCGVIRDLMNDQTKSFYGRGFPKDLSYELQEILQKEQAEIDIKNETEPEFNHDWRYGKSWCLLSELNVAIEENYNKALKFYLDCKFEDELEKIYNKLDIIYNHLVPPDPNLKTTVKKDEYEEVDFDELDDLIYAKGFCDSIENLTNFITNSYTLDGNIRLVFYTE